MNISIMAGLTLVTASVIMILSRQTRPSDGRINGEENKQASAAFQNQSRPIDRIDQQSEASFPASDPPSWSGSIAGGSR